MKKRVILITACIVAVILLLVSVWFFRAGWSFGKQITPAPTATPTPQSLKATLEIYSEPVWTVAPGESEENAAEQGQIITSGTTIKTGDTGRAAIVYPNRSVTRLDFSTEIILENFVDQPAQVRVKIEKHRIWSRVAKLLGQESYTTKTNTVIATVRGTSYGHGILTDGKNKITAKEGAIDTNCSGTETEVLVPKDKKVILGCKKGEIAGLQSIVESDRDEWFKFNASEDQKLDDLFGKEKYEDEKDVLGTSFNSTGSALLHKLTPTPALIDCLGVDGKTSRVTKEVCDSVNTYWKTHPPPKPTSTNTNTGSTSNTGPTNPVILSPTLPPSGLSITGIEPICVDLKSCRIVSISIIGTNLSTVTAVDAIDASGRPVPASAFSYVTPNISAQFNNLVAGQYQVRLTDTIKAQTISTATFTVN